MTGEILVADHWSAIDAVAWPWPNFTPGPPDWIASRGDGSLQLDVDAMDRLQWIRTDLERPVRVNSAYRDPIYNARIGGAALSRHKIADAFDLSLRGQDAAELEAAARAAGFTGFGYYQTFLHADRGPVRTWYGGEKARRQWTS